MRAAVLPVVLAGTIDVQHHDRMQRAPVAQHVEQRDQAVAAAGARERVDLVQLRRLLAEQRALHGQARDARDHARGLRLALGRRAGTAVPGGDEHAHEVGACDQREGQRRDLDLAGRCLTGPGEAVCDLRDEACLLVRMTAPATWSSASSNGPRSAVPRGMSSSGAALRSVSASPRAGRRRPPRRHLRGRRSSRHGLRPRRSRAACAATEGPGPRRRRSRASKSHPGRHRQVAGRPLA